MKRVLLIPLDPVHDVGLKMIRRGLEEAGHETILLPPDLPVEEVMDRTLQTPNLDCILVSRTIGYDVAEILGKFMNAVKISGLRDRVKIGVGGMGVRVEVAEELGFDQGFGPGTTIEEAIAFVENRPPCHDYQKTTRVKKDMTSASSYRFIHSEVNELLNEIAENTLDWTKHKTSSGIERAYIRRSAFRQQNGFSLEGALKKDYVLLCDSEIQNFYHYGRLPSRVGAIGLDEVHRVTEFYERANKKTDGLNIHHTRQKPEVFIQYGTGSLFSDVSHIKVSEAWGTRGVVHFDPAWGARTEGLLEGYLNYEGDGTILTPHNLSLLHSSLHEATLWQVRAHRGLNTPETVVLAGELGADLTKINMVYGSLGAGTDPKRLVVDGMAAMGFAAEYDMPFDIVTNEELCGVPAYKAFAGMLIVAKLGCILGGKPILQPLFCYSPEVLISGKMEDNYIDYNAAKITALRMIVDAPIWAGAPIGFMTHTEDRVQSSISTALHAALGTSLGLEGITIASSDEAYSGGSISAQARIDTLRGVREAFRFLGNGAITPTSQAAYWAEELVENIISTLKQVRNIGFIEALYSGVLGSVEDGAYPGRAGRGSVKEAVKL